MKTKEQLLALYKSNAGSIDILRKRIKSLQDPSAIRYITDILSEYQRENMLLEWIMGGNG